MENTKKPITPRYIYVMFLCMLLFYLGGAIVASMVLAILKIDLGIIGSLVMSQALIWGGLILFMLITRRNPFMGSDFRMNTSFGKALGTFLLIPIFTVAIYPVVIFLNFVTMLFADNAVAEVSNSFKEYSFLTQLVIMAVIPAVSEELICRGALMGGLKRHKIFGAALISGLFFGILHLNINQFCYATFLGVMLALLNESTGYIYSSMFVHFLINSVSVVLTQFRSDVKLTDEAGEELENASQAIQNMTTAVKVASAVIYGVLAVIGFAIAVAVMYAIACINNRNEHLKGIFVKGYENTYEDPERPAKKLINGWLFAPVVLGFAYMILTEFLV